MMPVTSFSLSSDGRYALVNASKPAEIHLWDLEKRRVVQKFYGLKQERYIVRSALGGVDDAYVVSGSEGTANIHGLDFVYSTFQ